MKKKGLCYAAAFFVPFLASLAICIANGVYPFGDRCILHVDMYHQYCPFFTELLNKLQNGESLLYTWKNGLGSDFVALYAYYLASPLNWLLIFWPKAYVIEFMTLTILLKIGLAGLCMYAYLTAAEDENEGKGWRSLDPALVCLITIVFSCAYALSGFVAAYSWDIMWMDGVALFPLVMLGQKRLREQRRPALYYVSLSLTILANYYIGMIVCIYLAIWYFATFFEQKKGRWRAACDFIWYSLLAGGTSAVLLVPEAIVLSYSGSAGFSLPKSLTWYFGILPELSRICTMAETYSGTDHWPNLYAGAFSILLFFLYLTNSRIHRKKKLPRILLVVFFFVSFSCNYLDFFWHGLHFPDSLPGRQSFLYIFLILTLGYEALRHFDGIGIVRILISGAATAAILVASGLAADESVTDPFAFVLTGLFAMCYLVLLLMGKLAGTTRRYYVAVTACVLAIGEITVNMSATGFYTTSRTAYLAKMNDYEALLDEADISSDVSSEEDGTASLSGLFYRVEDPLRTTKNDSALYGYASVTEFSSLMNINVSHFYQGLYMEGGKNFYCFNGSTPLTAAMLSVRYEIFDNDMEGGALRTLIAQSGDYYLYENTYCLPLGYMVPEAVAENFDNSDSSHIDNLNSLAALLGATEDMLTRINVSQAASDGSTVITIPEDGIYYAAYEKCSADSLKAAKSNGWERKYSKTTHSYLMEFGECSAGDEITVTNTKDEKIVFKLYKLNLDAVDAAYQTLSCDTLSLTSWSDTSVEGTVDVAEDGSLVLSIPYQEGWTLTVDGGETTIDSFCDALIAVPLAQGTHTIRLSYRTPGLDAGAGISAVCVLLFLLSMFVRAKRADAKTAR